MRRRCSNKRTAGEKLVSAKKWICQSTISWEPMLPLKSPSRCPSWLSASSSYNQQLRQREQRRTTQKKPPMSSYFFVWVVLFVFLITVHHQDFVESFCFVRYDRVRQLVSRHSTWPDASTTTFKLATQKVRRSLTSSVHTHDPTTTAASSQAKTATTTSNHDIDNEKTHRPPFMTSQKYLLPNRSVSVRSVDWSCGGMLPLQMYRVAMSLRKLQTSHPKLQLFQKENSWEQDNEQNHENKNTTSSSSSSSDGTDHTLSRSSQLLVDQYATLSPTQQKRLIQKIQAEQRASQPVWANESLHILYHDEYICVTCKPSGVLSVPGPRRNPSLADLVYDCLQPPNIKLDQMIVHRLDMSTSGIIVYALTLEALQKLHQDFKDRRVQKTYQALIHGHYLKPERESDGASARPGSSVSVVEGEINVALERDPDNPPFMRIAQPREDTTPTPTATTVTKTAMQNNSDSFQINDSSSSPSVSSSTPDSDSSSSSSSSSSSFQTSHKFWTQAPKESLTTYSVLSWEYHKGRPVTRVELRPWTGRTHQLRVHCATVMGGAIVGDDIYGEMLLEENDDEWEGKGPLLLHAQRLCLYHPISGAPMIFEVDAPF